MKCRVFLTAILLTAPLPRAVAAEDFGWTLSDVHHPCAPKEVEGMGETLKATNKKLSDFPFQLVAQGGCSPYQSFEVGMTNAGSREACKKAVDGAIVATMKQLEAECAAYCTSQKTKWTKDPRRNRPGVAEHWRTSGSGQYESMSIEKRTTGACM